MLDLGVLFVGRELRAVFVACRLMDGALLGPGGHGRFIGSMRPRVRVEQIASSVEDLMAVSAARESAGACKHGFLHAENRFAVGTAGG